MKIRNLLKANLKEIRTVLISAALAVVTFSGISGIYAYQTDKETLDNVFTTGKVTIKLTEPNYPGNTSEKVKNQLGHQETPKDPMITNTGVNDAVVFIRMTVPVQDVITVNEDGTKNASAKQELYFFKQKADAASKHANNFNANWIELSDKEKGTDLKGKTRTYVFGYKTKIAKDAKTSTLFDKIQYKQILEGNLPSGTAEDIKIEAFAIQADSVIVDGNVVDTSSNLSAATLSRIYQIYVNQNGK